MFLGRGGHSCAGEAPPDLQPRSSTELHRGCLGLPTCCSIALQPLDLGAAVAGRDAILELLRRGGWGSRRRVWGAVGAPLSPQGDGPLQSLLPRHPVRSFPGEAGRIRQGLPQWASFFKHSLVCCPLQRGGGGEQKDFLRPSIQAELTQDSLAAGGESLGNSPHPRPFLGLPKY